MLTPYHFYNCCCEACLAVAEARARRPADTSASNEEAPPLAAGMPAGFWSMPAEPPARTYHLCPLCRQRAGEITPHGGDRPVCRVCALDMPWELLKGDAP